jgi:hypothetical protein
MRIPTLITLFFAGLSLTACQYPNGVGGPCTYVSAEDIVELTQLRSSHAILSGLTESYEADTSLFDSEPVLGQQYKIKLSVITEGTCTPRTIHSIEVIKSK